MIDSFLDARQITYSVNPNLGCHFVQFFHDALDSLRAVTSRILYTPKPLRRFEIPKGWVFEPCLGDKGTSGWFVANDFGRVGTSIVLYHFGTNYAVVAREIRSAIEVAGAKLVEIREVQGATSTMHLLKFANPIRDATVRKFDVHLISETHTIFLQASADTPAEIEAFISQFSKI